MSDATTPGIIAGVVSAISATGLGTMLFKGDKIVMARELANERSERAKEVAGIRSDLATVLARNERLDAELREQYRVNAELSREVFAKIDVLQSLAGVASRERRSTDRG